MDVVEEIGRNLDPHHSDRLQMALEDYTIRCQQPQFIALSRSSLVSDCCGACACNIALECASRGFSVYKLHGSLCTIIILFDFHGKIETKRLWNTQNNLSCHRSVSLTTMYIHLNNIVIIAFFALLGPFLKETIN